jgi:hypothetical protein
MILIFQQDSLNVFRIDYFLWGGGQTWSGPTLRNQELILGMEDLKGYTWPG